jgi:hypothetical protein
MLAFFLRIFAKKVTAYPSPRSQTCVRPAWACGKPGQIYFSVVQLIDLLPFLKIRQVALKITAFDEHRLAMMTALNNMVGKPGTITLACLGISISLLLKHRFHSVRCHPILTEVRRGLVVMQISAKPSEKPLK